MGVCKSICQSMAVWEDVCIYGCIWMYVYECVAVDMEGCMYVGAYGYDSF